MERTELPRDIVVLWYLSSIVEWQLVVALLLLRSHLAPSSEARGETTVGELPCWWRARIPRGKTPKLLLVLRQSNVPMHQRRKNLRPSQESKHDGFDGQWLVEKRTCFAATV